jgi:hypothetical protein
MLVASSLPVEDLEDPLQNEVQPHQLVNSNRRITGQNSTT